ncbi:hypothetical protein A1O7_07285 [Cladophialophora yegresii CBS 114405]|uniref:Uncharacterized protein n=1 Tax=Cladophialophora yegresii CBS 114405 TaxID=1182544 RepID=W9VXI8_9EURO|nr:uncharacterized protein A1O7_07285 [Cladophialophora yegresii CBS 114405]EXJ56941.1 hypothetical protein A1O7_07285 [Cladophialophora yegresii CBS 114405]
MEGNRFLKLAPEEDLKSTPDQETSLPKFLKLTPDPPKNTGSKSHDKPDLHLKPDQPACKSSGKKPSASICGHEVGTTDHTEMPPSHNKAGFKRGDVGGGNETAQGSNARLRQTANIEQDVDWVDYGFQLPPRRFY